jgi:hypothetical protein
MFIPHAVAKQRLGKLFVVATDTYYQTIKVLLEASSSME